KNVSHNVECEGDTLHCSFVVVKADNPWHYSDEGVELTEHCNVRVCAHYAYDDQHAKDEHINPILDQIAKLEEALYDIHFQQHWFDAQTERQSIVNKTMSRRAIYKAMLGSFFLITASFLQIHLLKRLFDRKQGLSRA
ncbi:hypothetical protein CICLE_v10018191mg, partial [Citrus x clementina]